MWKHIFSVSLGLSLCTSFLCLASCFLTLLECEQQTSKNLWTGLGPVPAFVCSGTEAGPLEPRPSTPEGRDRADEQNGGLPPGGPPTSVSAPGKRQKLKARWQITAPCSPAMAWALQKHPTKYCLALFSSLFSLSSSYHINVSHLTAGKDSETSEGGR